jgi:exodeoxyribonuclease V alpha subunit
MDLGTSNPQYEQLQGVVERLTYHSQESGYTIARLKVFGKQELLTIVGNFANIQPGQTLHLSGFWQEHPQYGSQFQVNQYRETKPATLTGIEKYLGSSLIKGVGPVTAKRIVAYFGLSTLDVIENQIEQLIEVPGIAKKRIKLIQAAWETQKAIKEVMVFLQSHKISTTYAVKIYKQYGDSSIAIVTENPYQLAKDVYGIGFVTADIIARNLGIAPNSEFRYRCGILHVLDKASEDGHCFLPQPELIETAVKLLSLPDHQPEPEQLLPLTIQMVQAQELVVQDGLEEYEGQLLCCKPEFFYTEQNLAARFISFLGHPIVVDLPRVQRWIERFTEKAGIKLNLQQQQAVEMAASSRVLILTGGPGTGKTFTTRTIVALWKAMGKSIAQASPTGRAAQRLSEMTRLEAKTLHRLLEFDPKTYSFQRNQENPIPAQAIVVDEASMLDLFLANSLTKAIANDAQLLIVGDVDQLPSVGPGQVLQDLIASQRLPMVRLTEVFRQAQTSSIITNAHRINQGQYPKLEPVSAQPQSDCLLFNLQEPVHGVEAIRTLIDSLIPNLGFNSATDVQVLCPMTRGEMGTRNLNTVLQQIINPPSKDKAEITRGGTMLRVGDRVIQKKNNYNREVFNGDLGIITSVDLEEQEITVQFEERLVVYDYADSDEIALAWSITIHKSQGSEYPVVILPVFMQHYTMLTKNLLYTGLTRAKRLAILVGQEKAIGLAIRQVKDNQRHTLLTQWLNQAK